ncbi:MAG: hypothetical protein HC933_13605 [Pleurocapsa sp. SU_196_0]|nr:hypothetical protein [Pleurocapsa sp. SU_196_0]
MRTLLIGTALVAFTACNAAPTPPPQPKALSLRAAPVTELTDLDTVTITRRVDAALGGDIALERGLTLNIPPDALPVDATVTLTPVPIDALSGASDLPWVSTPVTVDLGGVIPTRDLELCFDVNPEFISAYRTASSQAVSRQTVTSSADPVELPLVGAILVDENRMHFVKAYDGGIVGRVCWSVTPSLLAAHHLIGIVGFWNPVDGLPPGGGSVGGVPPRPTPPPSPAPVPGPPPQPKPPAPKEEGAVLQVPFYTQGLSHWASPTAAAMVYNFHKTDLGLTSNWFLAGRNTENPKEETSPGEVAHYSPLPKRSYSNGMWTKDSMKGDAFKNYLIRKLQGTRTASPAQSRSARTNSARPS